MLAVPTGRGGDGPADSWLGGRPRYLDGRERPAPTCGACAAPLPLVAQISAPVDGRGAAEAAPRAPKSLKNQKRP